MDVQPIKIFQENLHLSLGNLQFIPCMKFSALVNFTFLTWNHSQETFYLEIYTYIWTKKTNGNEIYHPLDTEKFIELWINIMFNLNDLIPNIGLTIPQIAYTVYVFGNVSHIRDNKGDFSIDFKSIIALWNTLSQVTNIVQLK